MPASEKRQTAGKRVRPAKDTWDAVLKRANNACEWVEGNKLCGLKKGEIDPVGGGKVKLTPDHKNPHSINPNTDPKDINQWQDLCGRHQVMKRNYWDTNTGKMNVYAIIQSSTHTEKEIVFKFLLDYLGYVQDEEGNIHNSRRRQMMELRKLLDQKLEKQGIVIFPEMEAKDSMRLIISLGYRPTTTILDPWYNRGTGGVRNDYVICMLEIINT
ncbi:MAG: hypothetical protein LBF74_08940, partial [Treponema sp.]|nr:hypothetical protein [Treponema sp.]